MQINRKNFEAYFLDYHEQRLGTEQVAELMVFLEMNPDLQEIFDAFETVELQPEEFPGLPGKNHLKKKSFIPVGSINSLNYEQWMIASMEKDLDDDGQALFRTFLEMNPDARLEWAVFQKTKLIADAHVFPEKNKLHKRGLILFFRKPAYTMLAIAASLVLLFGLYRLIVQDKAEHKAIWMVENSFDLPEKGAGQFAGLLKLNPLPAGLINTPKNKLMATDDIETPAVHRMERPVKVEPLAVSQLQNPLNRLPKSIVASEVYAQSPVYQSFENTQAYSPKSFLSRFVFGAIARLFGDTPKLNKSILEYSIEGYNLMADRDVELEKQFDAQGKVIAYSLDGEVIQIGRRNPAKSSE